MKVDLTLDFEALLKGAKVAWKLRNDALEAVSKAKYSLCLAGKPMNGPEYLELEQKERSINREYQDWIKEILTDRGIQMSCHYANGEPLTLFIVVAGADSHILSAATK